MAATWLTELLLDTLNRALLQQGAAGAEPRGEGEAGGAYQQARCRCQGLPLPVFGMHLPRTFIKL